MPNALPFGPYPRPRLGWRYAGAGLAVLVAGFGLTFTPVPSVAVVPFAVIGVALLALGGLGLAGAQGMTPLWILVFFLLVGSVGGLFLFSQQNALDAGRESCAVLRSSNETYEAEGKDLKGRVTTRTDTRNRSVLDCSGERLEVVSYTAEPKAGTTVTVARVRGDDQTAEIVDGRSDERVISVVLLSAVLLLCCVLLLVAPVRGRAVLRRLPEPVTPDPVPSPGSWTPPPGGSVPPQSGPTSTPSNQPPPYQSW